MANRIRLGELLVRAGVIDEVKLKHALAQQQHWGGRLGKVLVDLGYVTEEVIVKAVSKQTGIPRADFSRMNVPVEILHKITPEFADSHGLCPEYYDAERRTLVVATADPSNVQGVDELRFKTGLRLETTLAGEVEISRAVDRYMRRRMNLDVNAIELDEAEEGGEPKFEQGASYATAMSPSGLEVDATARRAAPAPGGGESAKALEIAHRLDGAQKQQYKALKVMFELLVEKGVFSREEYMQLFSKR